MKNIFLFVLLTLFAVQFSSCDFLDDIGGGNDDDINQLGTPSLVFCDCEDDKSSQPSYCDVFCNDNQVMVTSLWIIGDNSCEFPTGCFEGIPMEINELKVEVSTVDEASTDAWVANHNGMKVAVADPQYGGSAEFDQEAGSVTFTFGWVNDPVLDEPLWLHVNHVQQVDAQQTKLYEEKYELGEDFFK